MQNLRDQLLKSGLASKKQKQQVEQSKRRERKRQQKGQVEEAALAQQRAAHEARLEAQRAADRERAVAQKSELEAKEKQLRLQHIIDYWQQSDDGRGDRRWYFTTRRNTIKHLYVSDPIADRLTRGDTAIVEFPDPEEERYVLVDREAAEHIAPIDHLYIRFSNSHLTEA